MNRETERQTDSDILSDRLKTCDSNKSVRQTGRFCLAYSVSPPSPTDWRHNDIVENDPTTISKQITVSQLFSKQILKSLNGIQDRTIWLIHLIRGMTKRTLTMLLNGANVCEALCSRHCYVSSVCWSPILHYSFIRFLLKENDDLITKDRNENYTCWQVQYNWNRFVKSIGVNRQQMTKMKPKHTKTMSRHHREFNGRQQKNLRMKDKMWK